MKNTCFHTFVIIIKEIQWDKVSSLIESIIDVKYLVKLHRELIDIFSNNSTWSVVKETHSLTIHNAFWLTFLPSPGRLLLLNWDNDAKSLILYIAFYIGMKIKFHSVFSLGPNCGILITYRYSIITCVAKFQW